MNKLYGKYYFGNREYIKLSYLTEIKKKL